MFLVAAEASDFSVHLSIELLFFPKGRGGKKMKQAHPFSVYSLGFSWEMLSPKQSVESDSFHLEWSVTVRSISITR